MAASDETIRLVVHLLRDDRPLFEEFMDVDMDAAKRAGGAWVEVPGLSGYSALAEIRFDE